jgi:hypothetical protein
VTGFDLAERCPGLAKAHRARRAELAAEREARFRARRMHQDALRILAHRELQLIRACATGDGRYIVRRQAKLAQAKRRLKLAERWMRKAGA